MLARPEQHERGVDGCFVDPFSLVRPDNKDGSDGGRSRVRHLVEIRS
jgi:hypothetical protein